MRPKKQINPIQQKLGHSAAMRCGSHLAMKNPAGAKPPRPSPRTTPWAAARRCGGTMLNSCSAHVPPSPSGHEGPDGFDQPERPSTLKKPISRTQPTCSGEGQDIPRAVFFQRIKDKHRRYSEKSKNGKRIHWFGAPQSE